jgi:hypothetical protein
MDETLASFIWSRNVLNGRHIQDVQVQLMEFEWKVDLIIRSCAITNMHICLLVFASFILFDFNPYRYALPLFFLCVCSNVGYIVVAVFIPENEDADSISEVLKILQKENPAWHPKNMMVDFSLAEIAAIDECFPRK